jgi:uncharacterized GH25 family protein
MRRPRFFSALFLILILSIASLAHDTWLLPRQAFVAPGTRVLLDLTSGMKFALIDFAIKPDRIDVARCRLNGKTFEIEERTSGAKSLQLSVTLPDPGIATIWVELGPKSLELTPKQVQEYFAELNASRELRQVWASAGKARRWRELYVKHAKTFVAVGANTADESWQQPVGMALEIVPETNPASLRAGDDFPVRVLRNGTPLANFSLGIIREGNTLPRFKTTDAAGRATFRLARPGKWLLRGTDLRQSTKPDTEWESDFTTLTIVAR